MQERKPAWLKVRLPTGERQVRYGQVQRRARALRLHTVCEEARCPNIHECWGGGTATFMVMGDVCTRGCRFCAVTTRRRGAPLDPEEPAHLGQAVAAMGLDYAVVTSVDRDDLPDHGAGHFAACIRAIRAASPRTLVEVLVPDFDGDPARIAQVLAARPAVFAHNVETVERLTPTVRDPRAGYRKSLAVLAHARRIAPEIPTKSSLMVGVGETEDEVVQAMADLREVGVVALTIGQYLRPTPRHMPVRAWIEPEQFARYERIARQMGFEAVASGPLVRSSYRAGELALTELVRRLQAEVTP